MVAVLNGLPPRYLYSRLVESAKNGPKQERSRSINALGLLRYLRAIGILEANLFPIEKAERLSCPSEEDYDAQSIVQTSINALCFMDAPRSHQILKRFCLEAQDPWMVGITLDDMGLEKTQFEVEFIFSFLAKENEDLVIGALGALWHHKAEEDRSMLPIVLPFLQSKSPDIRAAAIEFVAQSNDLRDLELIRPFFQDQERCKRGGSVAERAWIFVDGGPLDEFVEEDERNRLIQRGG